MDLDELLTTLDKVAVNLSKLEKIWERAQPLLPTGPQLGTTPEYRSLSRQWTDLLEGLQPIHGWTITDPLPDMNDIGQAYLESADIGILPQAAWSMAEKPGEDLSEYRYRLDKARRQAIGFRLTTLAEEISRTLEGLIRELPTREDFFQDLSGPRKRVDLDETHVVEKLISEVDRLLGDTVVRKGWWGDLYRHLRFGEVHDWHDIYETDWPSVLEDIDAAKIGDEDPIPVPDIDLGVASAARPTGAASTALNWAALEPDGFERLLYDLLRNLDGYQNVMWPTKTNAPDRGRDLSLEQVISGPGGTTRTDRVLVQAKHYKSKSVSPSDVQESLASLSLWEPPVIRTLIIATSSRFTSDAIGVIERHNEQGNQPYIEMWPDSHLEALLAQQPQLAITHGLRA